MNIVMFWEKQRDRQKSRKNYKHQNEGAALVQIRSKIQDSSYRTVRQNAGEQFSVTAEYIKNWERKTCFPCIQNVAWTMHRSEPFVEQWRLYTVQLLYKRSNCVKRKTILLCGLWTLSDFREHQNLNSSITLQQEDFPTISITYIRVWFICWKWKDMYDGTVYTFH